MNDNNTRNAIGTAHHTTTAVYQVTRLGHENCDITEGVLLDITPLVVDGKKLVTLYDKDLTEGINLLIVVSEQWGHQCVRLKVTVKSDNCGENADCSGKGVCFSNNSMEGYECQCCSGFAGSHCEEIDACTPSPCTNNGICVDLSQGHEGNAYQCLCPYGYTGKNCQFESDPCNPSQCLNGGTCVGNSTHFRCDCTSGYTGPLCQHNLNECESSPCVHGICVDQEDGFRCFCQPVFSAETTLKMVKSSSASGRFSGELCNFEYNECESNPCINGGQCIDNIGGFSCKCTRGYTGKRCHIKVVLLSSRQFVVRVFVFRVIFGVVDFCANDPCPDGHRCIDHGDDFTCECPGWSQRTRLQSGAPNVCSELPPLSTRIPPTNQPPKMTMILRNGKSKTFILFQPERELSSNARWLNLVQDETTENFSTHFHSGRNEITIDNGVAAADGVGTETFYKSSIHDDDDDDEPQVFL
nr:fibropellin-1-like [Aedes albopictus]